MTNGLVAGLVAQMKSAKAAFTAHLEIPLDQLSFDATGQWMADLKRLQGDYDRTVYTLALTVVDESDAGRLIAAEGA